MSCAGTEQQANDSMNICRKLQEEMPIYSVEREEVFKLLIIMNSKKPKYSAAEFFNIDRKTIFVLLNAIATYFIIIVQFGNFY